MQKVHCRSDIPGTPPAIDVIAAVVAAMSAFVVAIWLDASSLVAITAFVVGWCAVSVGCSKLRSRRHQDELVEVVPLAPNEAGSSQVDAGGEIDR